MTINLMEGCVIEHDDPETLVVWAFRRWVIGLRNQAPEQWDTVWRGMARRCGEATGREATAALAETVEALRRTARRTISHHQPCCPCLGDDEAMLLVLLGACQRGDGLLAQTTAQTLSGSAVADNLIVAATRLAAALSKRGLTLPPRDLPAASSVPAGVSVH